MEAKKDSINFNDFLLKIKEALSHPLPHFVSKMAPANRAIEKGDHVRDSAVLILLWWDGKQISTVFILRPEYDGIHSNQISFPGGKHEKSDIDFIHTALREAQEEIGIIPQTVTVLGKLSSLYISPSNFLVHPIVGFTNIKPVFVLDKIEVKEVLTCVLLDYLKADHFVYQDLEVRGKILTDIPCYKIGERFIWGATAMIFSELLEIIKPIVNNID